ncbi:hypothetical protein SCYZ1_28 [Pseudomonas phage SCYZ1]|nr:hypothetical protein SCYZ1_28 [Pseudomonas phage SCYZ1]
MYAIAKRGECKTKGLPYDLDAEYLESIWVTHCPALGLELKKPFSETGRGSHQTAHLDRYDPILGYIKGNVHWLSGRANRIKYDATQEELEGVLFYMKSLTNS